MSQLQCPHCKSSNVEKTLTGKVSSGAKDVGNFVASFGGKALGESIGFSMAGRAASEAGKWALSYTPIEFVCNACDSVFSTSFDTDGTPREIQLKKLPLPEAIIEKERASYIQALQRKRPYISAVIFLLMTLYCIICMFMGVADDNGVQIFFSFIFSIPFIIPTILKFKRISKINVEIAECEEQLPLDYKRSHRGQFTQYKQYN